MVSSLSVVHWTANELRIHCLWNRNWVGPAYSLRLIHISSYNWLAIIDSLTVWTPASVREENRAQWVDHALLYMLTSWHVQDYWPFVRGIHQHGGSCVHFSGISTCRRTSPETVSHPQRQPLPTAYKISLPVYVIVTNKRLQFLATTLYDSLVLSFSLLKI